MRGLSLLIVLALAGCSALRVDRVAPLAAVLGPEPPLERLWTRNADAAFGPAAPLVFDGLVLVGTRKGEVVAIDAETGRSIGKQAFGRSIEGTFALSPDGNTLYVGAAAPGQILAHDLERGERRWRWRGAPAQAGLTEIGGTVVAPLSDGTVLGLDAASGDVSWSLRPDTLATFGAAPVRVSGDHVVVADDRGQVRCLAAATGAEAWSRDVGAPVSQAPAVGTGSAGALVVVPTTRGDLVALDADTGAERWRVSLEASDRVVPRVGAPGVGGGLVVVGATNGRLVGLDSETGAQRWARTLDAHVSGAPLVTGGRVYAGTTGEELLVLDAETGETLWSTPVRGRVKSAVAGGDGRIYVLSEPRHVIAFGSPSP